MRKGKLSKPAEDTSGRLTSWEENPRKYFNQQYGKAMRIYGWKLREGTTIIESKHWKLVFPMLELRFHCGMNYWDICHSTIGPFKDFQYKLKIERIYDWELCKYTDQWQVTKSEVVVTNHK